MDRVETLVGAESVEDRLCAIVRAVEGRNVDANGEELWFEPEAAPGLQIRLGGILHARCNDRSANFTISYGGQPSGAVAAPGFRAVADSIKAIDGSPIEAAVSAFGSAAQAVARRFATPAQAGATAAEAHSRRAGGEAPNGATPDAARQGAGAPSEALWESPRARELNVIFLDLCARLAGRDGEQLCPLHWGFWPVDSNAPEPDAPQYDPWRAFSDALLAHVPETAERILDVGCGLGFNTKLLSEEGKRVTALSPVAHHCAAIERAGLPGVDVRCLRFEDLPPGEPYDLLLFSESVNHFSLADDFFAHCRRFVGEAGHLLMADDLTEERIHMIETQSAFRVVRSVDITANVAPTFDWWVRQMHVVAGYHGALMSVLELCDAVLAGRVREIVAGMDNNELKQLFSGQAAPPEPKGRYMMYLLRAV